MFAEPVNEVASRPQGGKLPRAASGPLPVERGVLDGRLAIKDQGTPNIAYVGFLCWESEVGFWVDTSYLCTATLLVDYQSFYEWVRIKGW